MKGIIRQCWAAFVMSLTLAQLGFMMVWPSYGIRYYEVDPTLISDKLTPSHISLLGSLPMLGCVGSTVIGAFILDRIGRKRGLILGALFYVVAWSIISTTKSITAILTARLFLGFGAGFCLCIAPITIAEVTESRHRGTIMNVTMIMFGIGSLLSYVMGWVCEYKVVNYTSLVIAVLSVGLLVGLKESPVWLIKHRREKEAIQSLKFYRGTKNDEKVIDELEKLKDLVNKPKELEIISNVNTDEKEKQEESFLNKELDREVKQSSWKILVSSNTHLRTIGTLLMLHILLVFMGSIAIITYAGPFFKKAAPNISPDLCSIILATSNLAGNIISMCTSDVLGRRLLHMTSCSIVTLTLVALASQLRWSWGSDWTVPGLMLAYSTGMQIGAASVPVLLMGECLVPEIKTISTALIFTTMWVSNFTLLAAFNPLITTLGLDGTFLVFAAVGGLTLVYSYLFVPETKGISPAEIQEILANNVVHFRRKIEK